MKHLLLTTIAAVLVVGCGPSVAELALIEAARDGNIEAVKQHLAAGADVNANDRGGMTPLHNTANEGHNEIAELLIANGADVNAKGEEGVTPLHLAARHKEVAELLIDKGADVNAKIEDGKTPLDLAILYKLSETADLLRKHGGKAKTPHISIHEAAEAGNIAAVKQHLAAGADVNAKDGIGGTPLYIVAGQSTRDFLRQAGKTGDFDGWTPLNYAAYWGHKEIAELLIAKGANVNAKDDDGETPLDWAIEKNHPEIVDILRKHGGKTSEELKTEGK